MSQRSVGKPARNQVPILSAGLTCLLMLALAIGAAGCGGGDDEAEEVPRTALVPGALDDTLHTVSDTTAWRQMGGTGDDDAMLTSGESADGDPGASAAAEPPVAASEATRTLTAETADPGAYSLQLGSFGNLENARRQAGLLRDNGYDPVLETSVLGGKTFHRVVLRGLPDKSAASALGERIHAELGITYLVRQNR